jgi:hypothetical protein
MSWEFLLRTEEPHVHVIAGSAESLCEAVMGMEGLREQGLETRWLRASKMRTANALFDEFAAALQFPPYFGENWDALDECLNDLDWLEGDSAALFILNADLLLTDAPPEDGRILFEILQAAESNLPFHIVMQTQDTTTVLEGLKAMDVETRLLPPLP